MFKVFMCYKFFMIKFIQKLSKNTNFSQMLKLLEILYIGQDKNNENDGVCDNSAHRPG